MPFFHRSYNEEAIASSCLNVATALISRVYCVTFHIMFLYVANFLDLTDF